MAVEEFSGELDAAPAFVEFTGTLDGEKPASRTLKQVAGDAGIALLKGAISLPESIVGLADIPTGGRVGKALESVGYRPAEAKQTVDKWYSPQQQAANAKVQSADGFVDTLDAIADNPSTIATFAGESLPSMIGGAGVARGLIKLAPKVAPVVAGAVGEGAISAGSAAEQIRNENKDRLLTPKQSAAAGASGTITGILGFAGGKLAQKFGIADVDTVLASGKGQKVAGGFVRQVVGSGISEGVFEELPQSVQEQMWQNYATDRPIMEGVGNAGAVGMVTGAVMGAAGGVGNAAISMRQPAETALPPADTEAVPFADLYADTPDAEAAPAEPASMGMQNRDRGTAASVLQMQSIANAPDFDRLGASPIPDVGAPLVSIKDNAEGAIAPEDIGAAGEVTLPDGAKVGFHYAVVDADSVLASHGVDGRTNPDYASPQPGQIVALNNGRTAGLQEAYARGTATQPGGYMERLAAGAGNFGINPQSVAGKKAPVLVRVYDDAVNARPDIARQANSGGSMGMSAREVARNDAANLPDIGNLVIDDRGEFDPRANAPFIRGWVASLPQNDQAEVTDRNGNLSQTGLMRLRNAVIANAYGDSSVFGRLVESLDDHMRNVGRALVKAAPKIAQVRELIKSGAAQDLDISGQINRAVDDLVKMRQSGMSLADFLAQANLFTEQKSAPEVLEILAFLDGNLRSPNRIADFLSGYYGMVESLGSPKQGDMFGAPQVGRGDLIRNAAAAALPETYTFGANDAVTEPGSADRGIPQEPGPAAADATATAGGEAAPSVPWPDGTGGGLRQEPAGTAGGDTGAGSTAGVGVADPAAAEAVPAAAAEPKTAIGREVRKLKESKKKADVAPAVSAPQPGEDHGRQETRQTAEVLNAPAPDSSGAGGKATAVSQRDALKKDVDTIKEKKNKRAPAVTGNSAAFVKAPDGSIAARLKELRSRYPVSAPASGAVGFADQAPDAGELIPTVSPQSENTLSPENADSNGVDSLAHAAATSPKNDRPEPTPAADSVKKSIPERTEMDVLKDEMSQAIDELVSILGVKMNLTPEEESKIIPVMAKLFRIAAKMGYIKFKDAARYVLSQIRKMAGNEIADKISIDNLQAGYINVAKEIGGDKREAMSYDSIEELENDNGTDQRGIADLERDSGNATAADAVGAEGVPDERRGNGGTGRSGVEGTAIEGGESASSVGGNPDEAISAGERSDSAIYRGSSTVGPGTAGSRVDLGSSDLGITGLPVEPDAAKGIAAAATSGIRQNLNRLKQKEADKADHQAPGIASVRAALPVLTPGQQEDVVTAEARFAVPDGYGMLFTNGTGTGKTFSGLGIIKRLANQGKTNILVVAPNNDIINAWIGAGKLLGLELRSLENTQDAGRGIVITTYANMGQNDALAAREWDLIVHDEAHYLAMDKDGTATNALQALRALSLHPDGAGTRHAMLYRDLIERLKVAQDAAKAARMSDDQREWLKADALQDAADKLAKEVRETRDAVKADVASKQGEKRPRVLFLSATPFAYEKTIDWANGYLFDYNEGRSTEDRARGYNEGSNRDQFFVQHFGYRMRYGKLTSPDAKVDSGLMQRQFNTWLKKRGSVSGRMLDVGPDYDRRFVLTESAIGKRIDDALQWFEGKRKENTGAGRADARNDALYAVSNLIAEKFDYLSRRYLLEAIKAREAIPHIREHLALGRKVVVFHDYKKGGGFNPFDLEERNAAQQEAIDGTVKVEQFNQVVREFRAEFRDLIESDLFKASSPIVEIQKAFPNALLYNGGVSAKDRKANVAKFQDDASGPQVFLAQSAAGREGISLHDTTGKYQRVLLNLGQPTQPTTAIQQEGRIYRTGQQTDAIFRYFNTGTNWEEYAFATRVATRSSTAENLGMGEQARALKDAFIAAFEESGDYRAGMEGEGKGGKERDRLANDALTEYDRARAYYFGTQKKDSRTKAKEGKDYFATPEPVGLKMVELADIRPGEDVLEPSGGHGAIARWFPENVNRTAIEPSLALRAKLAMVFDGDIIGSDFEEHNVVNKYDAIVMNPPFGAGGKLAVDHLAKAATHLRDGGRIVALLPIGPAADKRFDQWMYGEETRPVKPLFEHPTLGPIYRGDTVQTRAAWMPVGVLSRRDRSGALWLKQEGRAGESMVAPEGFTGVEPTGKRTEQVRPADGLYLAADIKMPAVTFERAGTKVMTRIVVIEKVSDKEKAAQMVERKRDYSNIDDIGKLFDRMEDLSIPKRMKPEPVDEYPAPTARAEKPKDAARQEALKADEAAQQAGVIVTQEQATFEAKDGKIITNAPLREYTTKAGKVLKGVWVPDQGMAKSVDPYAWKSRDFGGNYFVRIEHVQRPAAAGTTMFSRNENALPELQSTYEVPATNPNDRTIDGSELRDLRRAAARIESPDRGVTFFIAEDGRAIVTGPARTKVPDRFRRFADEKGLTLVVRRAPSGGAASGPAMPDAYRESGALYFAELPSHRHADRTGLGTFSSTISIPGTIHLDDLNAVASSFRKAFPAVPVVVLEKERLAPKSLRDDIRDAGAGGTVAGSFHEGSIYLIREGIRNIEHGEHVALHEGVHAGLSRMFGPAIDSVMLDLWKSNLKLQLAAKKIKDAYGYAQVRAVEEALADMGSSVKALKGWSKLVAWVRSKLRKLGLVKEWTDADVEALVLRALGGLKRGGKTSIYKGTALSRDENSGSMAGMDDANSVAGKQAPDPAGGGNEGGENSKFEWSRRDDGGFVVRGLQADDARAARSENKLGWAKFDIEGNLVSTGQDWATKPAELDLIAAKSEVKKLSELWKKNPPKPFFFRFGLPPSSGKSKHALSGKLEKGVSAYTAVPDVWGTYRLDENIRFPFYGMSLLGRPAYELSGKVVTTGSDGEPILSNVKVVREIGKDELRGLMGVKSNEPIAPHRNGADTRFSRTGQEELTGPKLTAKEIDAKVAAILSKRRGVQPIDAVVKGAFRVVGINRATAFTGKFIRQFLDEMVPESIKAGIVSDYGVPEAVTDRRDMMFGHMRRKLREVESTLLRLSSLTRQESRVAYEWMNNRNADQLLEQLPEDSRKVLQEIKRAVDEMSREAVRLGQLDAETYERHAWAYLHRSYNKWELESTDSDKRTRAKAIKVLGDQYKGRGMTDLPAMSAIQNAAPGWWNRKIQKGQADKQLRGQKFIRFERRSNRGEGAGVLPGMEGKDQLGRLLEVNYWPAGEPVPMKYLAWRNAGDWEVRGTKGEKVVMWRDFTREEQDAMGRIDEVRFAVAKTMHKMIHDLEVGKFFEWLASDQALPEERLPQDAKVVEAKESMLSTFSGNEWVQVPSANIPGTSVKRYGKLAGLYVTGPVWNDIRQVVNVRYNPLGDTYASILKAWKLSKTALSPAVHLNNIMANFVMADWHDVTGRDILDALAVIVGKKDEANKQIIERFEDAGGTQGMFILSEIQKEQLAPLVEQLRKEVGMADTDGQIGAASIMQALATFKWGHAYDVAAMTRPGRLTAKAIDKMTEIYQSEDTVFRLAAFMKAKREGASDQVAGRAARKSFLDYQINAPWIQMMRQTAFPFIAFTYRAVPMLLNTIEQKPWKLMKLALFLGAVNALGYAASGGDEDKERKLLPEEKAGDVLGAVAPKLIRMPWNEEMVDREGNKTIAPVFLDIRRFIPLGDIVDLGQTHSAVPILPMALPGGPLAIVAELIANRSQFTGKDITKETDTGSEQAGKVFDHLYKAFAPNLIGLPGTYATKAVVDAGTGRTDAFGREQSLPMAGLSAVGVKLGAYPPDVLQANETMKLKKDAAEIESDIRKNAREYSRNGMSESEFRDAVRRDVEKLQKRTREFSDKVQ